MQKKTELTLEQAQKIETFLLGKTIAMLEKNGIGYSLFCGSVIGAVRHKGPIPWDSDVDIIISIEDLERLKQACKESLEEPLYLDCYPDNPSCKLLFPRIGLRGLDLARIHVDIFLYSALPENDEDIFAYFAEADRIRDCFRQKVEVHSNNRNVLKRIVSTVCRRVRSWAVRESKLALYDRFMIHSLKCDLGKASKTTELGTPCYGPEKSQFKKTWWEDTILVPYDGIEVRIPRDYDDFLTKLYGNYMQFPPQEERDKVKQLHFWAEEEIAAWLKDNGVI